MTAPAQPVRYGAIARALHWIIAALIVVQYVLINLAEDNPSKMQQLALLARHKSVGMTVLMLAVVRLIWRSINPPPPLPATMKPYERIVAKATHVAFYGLLFALPLAGWLMSSARGYTVSWFGWFSWPNLIAQDKGNFETLKQVHEALAAVLFFLAILHIAAALKHHFWDKDDVLRRMLPFGANRSGS
jgi:cytochrome b561